MMRIEVNETLARMLATENLHIRYSPKAKTASFDVNQRLLVLPLYANLDDVVYLLLAGHEAFHALWTKIDRVNAAKMIDSDPANARRAAGYVNICEDVRIENLGKEMYPGMTKVFLQGYGSLVAAGFFGDLSKIKSKSLIDRVNIYFKAGAHIHVPFAAKELPYVQAVGKARTFDEMISAARALYQFARDTQNEQFPELEDQQNQDQQGQEQDQQQSSKSKCSKEKDDSGDKQKDDKQKEKQKRKEKRQKKDDQDGGDDSTAGDGEDDSDESDDPTDSNEGGDDSDSDEESDGESGGDSDDAEGDSDDSGDDEGDAGSDEESSDGADGTEGDSDEESEKKSPDSSKPADPHAPRSLDTETQDEFDRQLEGHCSPLKNFNYVTLPTVNLRAAVVDYSVVMDDFIAACKVENDDPITGTPLRNSSYTPKKSWFDDLRRKLEPDVMFMVQQFMMHRRADQYARTRTSTTGYLDQKRLWAHRVTENIFSTTEHVPDDKNHGMIMVVDWSGSMKKPLFDVLIQLLTLMMFCRRVNIPFEVYIFINRDSQFGDSFIQRIDSVGVAGRTRLYNIFSSRMSQMHFYQMCLMMFSSFNNGRFEPPLAYLNPDNYDTPLGEAMLIASEIVPVFQRQNRLQFVHTIFLTDGDGNSRMTCLANQLEDGKTRRTYGPEDSSNYIEVLHILPRVVRDRTGSKMIGFYVAKPTDRMLADSKVSKEKATELLNKEGFFSVTGTHYDAFYVVNPKMVVPNKIDPADAVTARMKSRVMLKQFIKMIA